MVIICSEPYETASIVNEEHPPKNQKCPDNTDFGKRSTPHTSIAQHKEIMCKQTYSPSFSMRTPRTWTLRAAIIRARSPRASLKAQQRGARVSRTMAVPDKVALGLFFFWWHGSSVPALPSSIPRMPLLLHRVLTRASDARCRGAQGHRNQM